MRMRHEELKRKPRTLRRLTGLTAVEFEALLPSFGAAWESFISEQAARPNRQRAYGARRKSHLKQLEDKLLYILFYYR